MQQNNSFDAASELQRIRAKKAVMRKQRHFSSRLDRYARELIAMRQEGAGIAELRLWLKERRICVHQTTVSRWIAKKTAS